MSTDVTRDRRTRLLLFASGALAALVTVAVMLFLRRFSARESFVELVGETVLHGMPMGLFALLLGLLGAQAKRVLLGAVVVGFVLAGGGLGQLDRGPAQELSRGARVRRAGLLALGLWVPAAIVALFAVSFGTTPLSNRGLAELAGVILFDVAVFVGALYLLYPLLRAATSTWVDDMIDAPPVDLGRRQLLAAGATAAVALTGAAYVGQFIGGIRGGAVGDAEAISTPITPNDDFYLISKNFLDPSLDADDWKLEISGLVRTPRRLGYADLLGFPAVEQLTTLTCISNEVGGDLISNATWTGVRLGDLLALAEIGPAVADVALYAADGYTESLPLAKALDPTTLLVYRMNDAPLPRRHGYPARLVVPGKYGIKNVKWLTKIELVAGDFRGYWQQRGWTEDATIRTMSRFDLPRSRDIVALGPVELAGIAFAGDRGISRVEVSTDDGATWAEVDELERVGPLCWVIWRSTWNPPGRGTYRLRVRATDGTGALQIAERASPIPDGATGYHRIDVGVA